MRALRDRRYRNSISRATHRRHQQTAHAIRVRASSAGRRRRVAKRRRLCERLRDSPSDLPSQPPTGSLLCPSCLRTVGNQSASCPPAPLSCFMHRHIHLPPCRTSAAGVHTRAARVLTDAARAPCMHRTNERGGTLFVFPSVPITVQLHPAHASRRKARAAPAAPHRVLGAPPRRRRSVLAAPAR